jgi:O-antigen ligase
VTRGLVLALLVGAIFPPFIPLAGPLSADDLLPVLALLLAAGPVLAAKVALPRDVTFVGFILLMGVAAISSTANAHDLAELGRMLGRSTFRMAFYLSLIVAVRVLFAGPGWPRRVALAVAGAATLEALFSVGAYLLRYSGPYGLGVVEFAWWSVLKGELRVQGTFGGAKGEFDAMSVSANFLAAYVVLTIPLTAALALSAKDRRWQVAGLLAALLQAATLYLTFTRAALLAFLVSLFAFGFLAGRRRLALAAAVLSVGMAFTVPKVRAKLLGEKHDRYALYWASAAITWDHPCFGIGDGNYDAVLHTNQRYHDTPFGTATATSHNSILLAAAHFGVLGGVAQAFLYLLLVLVMLRSVRRSQGHPDALLAVGIAAGLMGYLVQDQINNLAYVPKVATQMWLLVALLPLLEPRRAPRAPAVRSAPTLTLVTAEPIRAQA